MKSPTLIITKEGWLRLRDLERAEWNMKPFSNQTLERVWKKAIRNGGANPKLNPIEANEIRIDPMSFSIFSWKRIEEILTEEKLPFRQDGFIQESINI